MTRPWHILRQELGAHPVTAGYLGGDEEMYVERYLLHGVERSLSAHSTGCLVAHLGGAHVQEGRAGDWRTSSMPSQAVLVPPNCPTHWQYSGPVDIAIFYFPEADQGLIGELGAWVNTRSEPWRFTDALVSAAAMKLVDELHQGAAADQGYMARLTTVMLENALRVVRKKPRNDLRARPLHLNRLQLVLTLVRENLADDLSVERLAAAAQVSASHFRRFFGEAMGVPPHRYVLAQRLTRARELLSSTTVPLSQIAFDCGFSSQSHFTVKFREAYRTTPADYRASAQ